MKSYNGDVVMQFNSTRDINMIHVFCFLIINIHKKQLDELTDN